MLREDIQSAALEAWIGNNCNGALILGTGVGKTKIAIDAIRYYISTKWDIHDEPNLDILWLTNSERLRDIDTKEDFRKWGAEELIDCISFQCIQTAYKWDMLGFDLVIVDEGDFMLTPEYSKFFTNNTYSNILFLTATVDKNKQEMLDSLCPTVYKYTTTQAQDEGILNKSTITFLKFMLDNKDKYIKVKGKGNSVFYQTENDAYEYLEKRCISELLKIQNLEKLIAATQLLSTDDTVDFDNQLKRAYATHKFWTTKRANFLWELKSSRVKCSNILMYEIVNKSNTKCLIFSKRTEQVEQITTYTYHAKNKKDNHNLERLSEGSIRCVGVVQAVNRGVNLVGLTHAIFESYDGSKTSFQQRHGRICRLGTEEVANVLILVPYYKNKSGKVVPTQAYKWAKDMTSDFNNIKEEWI